MRFDVPVPARYRQSCTTCRRINPFQITHSSCLAWSNDIRIATIVMRIFLHLELWRYNPDPHLQSLRRTLNMSVMDIYPASQINRIATCYFHGFQISFCDIADQSSGLALIPLNHDTDQMNSYSVHFPTTSQRWAIVSHYLQSRQSCTMTSVHSI